MFVVLKIHNVEKEKIKRRQKKLISSSQVCPHSTEKGLPFFTLDILETKKGIDWHTVCEKCRRYASRIVAPRKTTLPDGTNLNRFIPRSIIPMLIFNTACRNLITAKLPVDRISITVTDRNAVMASQINRLLPFASQIRVVTSKPEKYAYYCVKAMEENGAAIMLRASYEATEICDIVICCDGVITPSMKNSVIFTHDKKSGGRLRFCGNGLELLPTHKEIIADDIDPADFAGALFELCGCFTYCTSCFSHIEASCNSCENSSVAECLRCVSGISEQLNS